MGSGRDDGSALGARYVSAKVCRRWSKTHDASFLFGFELGRARMPGAPGSNVLPVRLCAELAYPLLGGKDLESLRGRLLSMGNER